MPAAPTTAFAEAANSSRYDQLAAKHAKLQRANAELEESLELAKAVIQRLTSTTTSSATNSKKWPTWSR